MLFVLQKILEIAFMHVLPCYVAFRWAKKVGKNPWKWAILCFLFSYFALLLFSFLLNRKRLPTYEEYRRANPGSVTATGDDVQSLVSTLISTAGKFFESIGTMLVSVLHSRTSLIEAIGGAVLLFLAFVAVVVAALIYTWFLIVGKLMVAVGIALGSFAVAFGFLDVTRKYFTAWLDYMITGSMYAVVAATIAQLASAPLLATASDIGKIGTDTVLAAGYALTIAIVLVFIAMEVPKIAGSIFGTGGGISGTGGSKLLSRGAWNIGGKLAGKRK